MNKIPTAEEFISKKSDSFDTQMRRDTYYKGNVENLLIEFTKLHVTEALKQASEKARTKGKMGSKIYQIDKTTILNAYDLTNII